MLHPEVGQIKPLIQAAIPFMAPELQDIAARIANADPRLTGQVWEAADMVMSGLVTVRPGAPWPFEEVRVREFDSKKWHVVTFEDRTWSCDCDAGRFCIHELAAVLADEEDEDEMVLSELLAALASGHRSKEV